MSADAVFNPTPGKPELIAPHLRRILAPNPSPMTWRGTNTYMLGNSDIAVIDPGPQDPAHLEAILSALDTGQRITHILVTHAHLDHSPLAEHLSARTDAPVYAYGDARAGRSAMMTALAKSGEIAGGEGVDRRFSPDITLKDNDFIEGPDWRLEGLWTPGHFGNHMSFRSDDTIFTGDLVMGWASSLVSPPDGDLTDFMASCHRLRNLGAARLMPGHGAPIEDPHARLSWLIEHRRARETAIVEHLHAGPANARQIADAIYTDTPPGLMPAATRNVLAHLIDLYGKNIVSHKPPLAAGTIFTLN
ncbi:MBL fold metallo-hydrolase [Pseudohalocynthiibacter aestuariivivens]|nr:MBL fold metallo-hydrolase [Pseudohalocynthiibacter aestuariivivens]QIE44593.1 MBL fold metallo-hydrolase [Pseudohalocynthiibacter aestuariivivens]